MPIKMNCPACEKPYTLADNQAGKRVRCRNCSETFTVPGDDKDIPTVEFADDPPPLRGAMTRAPRSAGAAPPVSAPRVPTRELDRANPPVKAGGSSLVLPLVIGGIALFLLLLIAGVGVGIYVVVSRSTAKAVDDLASAGTDTKKTDANDKPWDREPDRKQGIPFQPGNNPPVVVPGPGPGPGIRVNNPPNINFPQGDDFRTPEDVLARLSMPGDHFSRRAAAQWLLRQPVDPDKQAKIAKGLETAVNLEGDVFIRGDLVKLLAQWATMDQMPTLLRVAQNDEEKGAVMDAMVRLKDTTHVGWIVPQLKFGFGVPKAQGCLITLGKDAQPEVLKYMNHPDDNIRGKIAEILVQYDTPDADKIRQALQDLNNPVTSPTASPVQAANYLATVPIIPEQQQAITRSLEMLCRNIDQNARNAGLKAYAAWAGKENIPAIGQALLNKDFHNHGFPTEALIGALVRLKDNEAASLALVPLLNNPFERGKAKQGLINMGPNAEDAVLKYLVATTDIGARNDALQILGAIGTRKKSGVALQRIMQTNDRGLQQQAALALQQILSRPEMP